MSLDPEDFKDKPETCRECGRPNVWRTYAWQMRVCDECQGREDWHRCDGPCEQCDHGDDFL